MMKYCYLLTFLELSSATVLADSLVLSEIEYEQGSGDSLMTNGEADYEVTAKFNRLHKVIQRLGRLNCDKSNTPYQCFYNSN